MAAVRNVLVAVVTLAVSAATGACGGSQERDRGGRRAQYTVQANLFCESLRTELIALPRPLTHPRLARYLARADDAVRLAAAGLHDARRTQGSEASPQIRAFDRKVDGIVHVISRLADEPVNRGFSLTPEEQRALVARAKEARQAFGALRRSAQAAGLRHCGLGGDDLADGVLFTTYRAQYLRIQGATFRSLRRAPFRSSDNLSRYLRTSRRYLAIRAAEYRRVRRLTPPTGLRSAHDVLLERFADAIRVDRQLQAAFYRGRSSDISQSTARLQRSDDRYFAAERKLRALLDRRPVVRSPAV
jgi:hypothetical protein